jgi:hypothetical protein
MSLLWLIKRRNVRQYYRLPEREAHTALGNVDTVADLFSLVLRPKAEAIGLDTWNKVRDYAAEEWYPTRFAFGKFKGRTISEARSRRSLTTRLCGTTASIWILRVGHLDRTVASLLIYADRHDCRHLDHSVKIFDPATSCLCGSAGCR